MSRPLESQASGPLALAAALRSVYEGLRPKANEVEGRHESDGMAPTKRAARSRCGSRSRVPSRWNGPHGGGVGLCVETGRRPHRTLRGSVSGIVPSAPGRPGLQEMLPKRRGWSTVDLGAR